MKFTIKHMNINVCDMEKSLEFYKNMLGFELVKETVAKDGSFRLCFLSDEDKQFKLELTWLRDKEGAYNLGDNETHFAVSAQDYDSAYKLHKEAGCICYENTAMGLYFINDPDGYWIEILPDGRG